MKPSDLWSRIKYWIWAAFYWIGSQINRVWGWFEKDMPKVGGPLPSLTDMQFLRREGYVQCMKDITEYIQSTHTQSDQLVLVRLIEYLNRKGRK
jgi:hypothetical protein